MGTNEILGMLHDHPPSYAPEWGSGGIFGLKYYRGVLYYTLAFDAVANFVTDSGVERYRFEQVGPLPTSGGDTYNAVDAVDDSIYFGGWVHAPAVYEGSEASLRGTISFVNKYSHVHFYDVEDRRISLLWKEGAARKDEWAGEVSEIIYNPVQDELLIARGDGTINLGVYSIDRRTGEPRKLSERPALKGTLVYEYACFDILERQIKDIHGVLFTKAVTGIQCVNLTNEKVTYTSLGDISRRSVDGAPVSWPQTGPAASAYGRFFLFVKGGAFVGNPIDEGTEPVRFVRLFDFGDSGYFSRRTVAKPIGGGVMVAFNAYSESLVRPTNQFEEMVARATNTIVGPSVLLYITPPVARIVGAYGARITSFESVGDRLVIGANTMSNTSRYNALPLDIGYRGFIIEPISEILERGPPVRFSVLGLLVKDKVFGGIPLAGYSRPRLVIRAGRSNRLHVYEYDFSLPAQDAYEETYDITGGKNVFDLSGFGNSILSFRLEDPDPRARIVIDLQ
ncbi:DUF2139 domain-containing protein [Acidilobus sp.]|uniref:DUF2139 domain-containing protein n=1 Tax=Acidilobus sp. TaxID=1872109 RepID=UPI003CFFB6B1